MGAKQPVKFAILSVRCPYLIWRLVILTNFHALLVSTWTEVHLKKHLSLSFQCGSARYDASLIELIPLFVEKQREILPADPLQ